jgi:hypothetical protein
MIDLVDLTHTIAEIANKSREPDIAIALMELVDRLLTEAGLPPAGRESGVGSIALSSAKASGKESPSLSMSQVSASPCLPQPKQW